MFGRPVVKSHEAHFVTQKSMKQSTVLRGTFVLRQAHPSIKGMFLNPANLKRRRCPACFDQHA